MAIRIIGTLLIAASLSACGGGGIGLTQSATTNSASNAGSTQSQITSIQLSGTPPSSVTVGSTYAFQPVSSPNSGVAFSISGQPAWVTFNVTTGAMGGTPGSGNVGTSGAITITGTDGGSKGTLGPFSIQVNAAPSGTVSTPPSTQTPTISGSPTTTILAGSAYGFTPTTTDPSGAALTFSIQNTPAWAAFNPTTGQLSGTPGVGSVGNYANITISVSDGTASAALPAFSIAVTQTANGAATLSWTAPTQNTDGTSLTNLAGYWIYYGTSASAMTQSVQIANPGIATYVVDNLSPGTWYFSVAAYTATNVQSAPSAIGSKTVT